MTFRFLASGLLLVLAACEKTPNPVQSGKSASAAAASQAVPVSTLLAPGLWATSLTVDDAPLPAADKELTARDKAIVAEISGAVRQTNLCLDATQAQTPNATLVAGHESGQCSFESFSLQRGILDAVITCAHQDKPGRTMVVVHGPYGGTKIALDAVLRVEPDTPFDTVKGPMPPPDEQPIRFHARVFGRYKGACPAGEDVAQ